MKIIIKSFLCIYFITLAGLSVVALMKCIVETDSLSSKIKGSDLKCPFVKKSFLHHNSLVSTGNLESVVRF